MVIGLGSAFRISDRTPHGRRSKSATLGHLVRVNAMPVLGAHTVRHQELVQRIRRLGQ